MKHFVTYLAHYAAIVAGAAAFIGTHTAIITSVATAVSPTAVAAAAGVIGVASAIVAALHALGIDPQKSTTPMLAILAMTALAGGSLTACSTLPSATTVLTAPAYAPYVEAAVDVAVATAESRGITAAQINAIARQAFVADQSASASLAAISSVVTAEIAKLKLPAADQAAIDIVLTALSASVQTQLQANPTVAQVQVAAAVVINDVIAATGG